MAWSEWKNVGIEDISNMAFFDSGRASAGETYFCVQTKGYSLLDLAVTAAMQTTFRLYSPTGTILATSTSSTYSFNDIDVSDLDYVKFSFTHTGGTPYTQGTYSLAV